MAAEMIEASLVRNSRIAEFTNRLELRRRDMRDLTSEREIEGQRTPAGAVGLPVLAVLCPVVTSTHEVVEYPGDPVCLYAALVDSIDASVEAMTNDWDARPATRDIVLDWGRYPTAEYRAAATIDGVRTPLNRRATVADEMVFDPRLWDEISQRTFVDVLLAQRPRVLLLSAVSAAHRYALDIARLTRQHLPGCFIVLGGRHADETLRWNRSTNMLDIDPSSTLTVHMSNPMFAPVDVVISGTGAPLLHLVEMAACTSLEKAEAWIDPAAVPRHLRLLVASGQAPAGEGVIAFLGSGAATVFPVHGTTAAPPQLNLYRPFAIRSRFDVFTVPDGRSRQTAHLMTASTCPFQCTFCSESAATAAPRKRLGSGDIERVLTALTEVVSHGAEAVFFDDPVFWSGSWSAIRDFAFALRTLRTSSDQELSERFPGMADAGALRRWRSLVWGGQLTIDVVLDPRHRENVHSTLLAMRESGCTYIYIGIESMAEAVMAHVRKNLRRDQRPWPAKVREVLCLLKDVGITVGSSVLFGLDGESRQTIDVTVDRIGALIDEGLLALASPNILTYHPATSIRGSHRRRELDYHSMILSEPPFTYFEEAYDGVVSDLLTTDDIWYIHHRTRQRWGNTRNAARPAERNRDDACC
ncbi:B12-binding domain-containing radical SAM protein [Salinispora arenicola]|uniref:B12-binding domain-containing radical SAM protein n=1 Tax=Salinispora arenicola TaxID=168697 RepID=UPI0003827AE6|nr:B12-binding domain-containing radical SAM protein [Salinispora arenicola]